MNKWEKEVLQSLLDSEEGAIKELETQYKRALKDIGDKVKGFQADIDLLDAALNQEGLDDDAKALLLSQKRSKIYQKQYQEALQGQVSGILDNMQGANYATIDKYLKECYEDGYIGTMYDIAHQGIPVIAPIDQAAAVRAILTDSKVSGTLYGALGVDVAKLKKSITQEISRGIASSLPYADIARNIDNVSQTGLYNAKRIARTEGHRIQQTATRDAQQVAKSKGADVVKQWDASLDARTRPSHARVDGEIRELDEKFSNGLDRPGDPSGRAAEVVNCRCACLTRSRWALDEAELETLKQRAEYFGLDKTKNFDDYKQKYLTATEKESSTKANFSAYKTEYDTNKAELMANHDKLSDTKRKQRATAQEISSLKNEIDIHNNRLSGYSKYADVDTDALLAQQQSLKARNEELSKIIDKKYDRPRRGTPERAEWDAWAAKYNLDEIEQELYDNQNILADIQVKLNGKKNYDDIFKNQNSIVAKQKRLKELQAEQGKLAEKSKALTEKTAEISKKQDAILQNAGSEFKTELEASPSMQAYRSKLEEAEKLSKEASAKREVYYKNHSDESYAEYRKVLNESYAAKKQATEAGKEVTRDLLKQIRPVGDTDLSSHLPGRSVMKTAVVDAYQNYPSEWIALSKKRGSLSVKKVSRGYYSDTESIIAISDGHGDGGFETAVHELGHRMEKAVPGILDAEKVFYERRTSGENLKWLGTGYAKTEVTRKDNFVHSYMGKDYGGSAYELVSMGFEYAFCDPDKLLKDTDMAQWIFGLLSIG